MDFPLSVVDQALRQFSNQWYYGLQPSINITTMEDGTVVIKSELICSSKPLFHRHQKKCNNSKATSTPKNFKNHQSQEHNRKFVESPSQIQLIQTILVFQMMIMKVQQNFLIVTTIDMKLTVKLLKTILFSQ